MDIFFQPKTNLEPHERVSLWIPRSLKQKLKRISEDELVSLNEVCRTFLNAMVVDQDSEVENNNCDDDRPWLY
jgi:hypothetical protein